MSERQADGTGAPTEAARPGLSAMRRFSTENTKSPLTMSLRDLPKPSFNPGPPGQRSVPAVPASSSLLRNPVERGSYTPGTLTPGAGGDMGMDQQPWNLFPDEDKPRNSNASGPSSRQAHSTAAGHDSSAWNARGSAWNDHKGSVGTPLASSTMAPSDAKSGLARSASYAGDLTSAGHSSAAASDGARDRQASGYGAANVASNLQSAGEGPSAPVANVSSASMTNNMPFDLAAGMADMSLGGLPGAGAAGVGAAGSNMPSGFDRSGPSALQQPAGAWPSAAGATSLPAQTWGAPAKTAAGFNVPPQAGSPYNSYYGFNPLGDQNVYGSPDPSAFDPYRRDSAYGSGVTSPMDMNLLGGAPAAQARRGGPGGWQMSDRSPTRSPSSNFNASMSGRSAAAAGYPGQMFPSAASQMQQSFFNPAASMGQRGMGYQGQGRMGASGYPEQVDYSAYGGTPYGGGMGSFADPYRGMPGASSYQDRSSRGMRSPLLEEFRANRHRRWDLSDLRGHIVEFSGDQLGSRHLQTKLDTATVEERRIFFEEAMPHILTLSTDLFSNYVVQKAFEISDHNQKLDLVHALEGQILQLSLQTYGCRVVQKAIESVMVDEQVLIVNELRGSVLKCARDQNANHVLQRILERVPADRVRFIAEACEGQVHSLATHPYGCRVLQRILENTSDVRPLIDELLKYTQTLMQDQYANYVCQHLLERGTKADRAAIIQQVSGNLVNLSRHKFASNVIDKVILCADEEERRLLIDEVLRDPMAVGEMLRDQFANYCLQKFMLVIQGPQRQILMERVAESLMQIRKYSGTFSKHLIAIEKFIANEQALAAYNTAAAAGMR